MSFSVHSDDTCANSEVFDIFNTLTNLFWIVAAALNGINQHFTCIVAESCEDVRIGVIFLLVGFKETFNIWVTLKIVSAEISIVEGVFAGNVDNFGIVPTALQQ